MAKDYTVGVDLGQMADYTAIAVVAPDEAYRQAKSQRGAISRAYNFETIRRRELAKVPLPKATLEVSHLERIPLGTRYPEVVSRIGELVETPPLEGNSKLVVDATGVGVAVVDMLRKEGLNFRGVTITSGERESRDGNHVRLPKSSLISAAQVALQNKELKIARSLPEAATLVEELLNFRYQVSANANLTYEAWREGTHDDLVLALSLAVWQARRSLKAVPGREAARATGEYRVGDLEF